MKTTFTLMAGLLLLWSVNTWAAATVALNNYDSMLPILLWDGPYPVLAPKDRTYVQLLANGSPITPIKGGSSVIRLKEDGYFDAGYGIVPGIPDSAPAEFQLLVWMDAPTIWDATLSNRETRWTQPTGFWDTTAFPPTGSPLIIPNNYGIWHAAAIMRVPEPHTWSLMIIGLSALIWKRARS